MIHSTVIIHDGKPAGLRGFTVDITGQKQAEKVLRESESFRRRVFESSRIPIVVMDAATFKYIDCNPAAVEIYRFTSREEILGKTPLDFSAPAQYDGTSSSEKARFYTAKALTEGSIVFEWRQQRPNGEIWDSEVHLMGFQSDRRLLLQFTLQDITGQKRIEKSLHDIEARYTMIMNNITDRVWLTDMNFKIIWASDSVSRNRGYQLEEISPLPFDKLLTPESLEYAVRTISEELTPERLQQKDLDISKTLELEFYRKDGSIFWSEATMKVIRDHEGTPVSILGVGRDITERKRIEETLRENEEKYRLIAENMADVISVMDMNLRFTYISPSIVRLRGLSVEDAMKETIDQILTPESLKVALAAFEEEIIIEVSGKADPARIRILELEEYRKDGSTIWVESSLSYLRGKDNKPLGMLATTRDISDRKRAEADLKKSEEKYRTIIENMEDSYNEVDLKGNFILFNESMRRMSGYEREELLGMNYRQYADEENTQKLYRIYNQVYRTGEPVKNFEWQIIRKDGDRRDIEGSVSLIRNTQGRPVGFRSITRDSTDRKRAEKILRESEKRYRSVIENIQDVFYRSDAEGRLLMGSPSGVKMFGYDSIDEMIGLPLDSFWPDPLKRQQFLDQIRVKGNVRDFETVLKRKDGSTFNASFTTHFYYDDNGKFLGTEGLIIDITERVRAEAEKKKLEEQFRQAQKMEAIGQLAGGVAHDFNNMLNIIQGYSQLALMKTEPSSPLKTDLQEIMNATKRSTDLVRQLLAFARKQTIAPKALDLNDTVAGMLNMLRKLIGEDIDLIWIPAANLWPVKMDPTQIDQILANLAVNARDSISGVGKISIETGKAEFNEAYCAQYTDFIPGRYVMLAVTDNGCGIDKETCEKIFEPFFTTKEIGKGTGMGLATVYGIVKQNNGFVKVYSEPGKGTTLKIYLPRHEEEETKRDESHRQAGHLQGTETVLLVEDNEALLRMAKIMLEGLGYTVLAAGSTDEAVKLAEQYEREVHLLVTDVVMPEMSGLDLQKRLCTLRPDMKYLFMSGYTANVIAHRGILDEGVHFLQKPFSMNDLAAKVREALEMAIND
jgi:PAS domain S-box-containing protein